MMIHLKSAKEIETMRAASKIVAEILLELREKVHEGATTAEVDKIAEDLTLKRKAKPAFNCFRLTKRNTKRIPVANSSPIAAAAGSSPTTAST